MKNLSLTKKAELYLCSIACIILEIKDCRRSIKRAKTWKENLCRNRREEEKEEVRGKKEKEKGKEEEQEKRERKREKKRGTQRERKKKGTKQTLLYKRRREVRGSIHRGGKRLFT